jgi:hypothetical protein
LARAEAAWTYTQEDELEDKLGPMVKLSFAL